MCLGVDHGIWLGGIVNQLLELWCYLVSIGIDYGWKQVLVVEEKAKLLEGTNEA